MDFHNLFDSVSEILNKWETRGLILLSLLLQIFLTISGNRRNYFSGIWVGVLVWLAYLSADSVATLSLGILARSQGAAGSTTNCTKDPINPELIPAFWAPIFLVHLGGPDTITAYSVEDNELWLRHLLQLLTQVAVASYALLRSWWSKDPLIFVSIPVFVAGIIKYGERIWVLRSGSYDRAFRTEEIKDLCRRFDSISSLDGFIAEFGRRGIPDAQFIREGSLLFETFMLLYAEYDLTFSTHMLTYHILRNKNAEEAFKLIDVELGLMFELCYTKAITSARQLRIILRSINFLSSVAALVVFSKMTVSHPKAYSKIDNTISYVLLAGAIILEFCSIVVIPFSYWTMLGLSKPDRPLANSVYLAIYSSPFPSLFSKGGRLFSLGQFNLIDGGGITVRNVKIFLTKLIGSNVEGHHDDCASRDLVPVIFSYLLDKRSRYSLHMLPPDPGVNDLKEILAERGDQVLRSHGLLALLGFSVIEVDFQKSLLMWHIATDICYSDDVRNKGSGDAPPSCKISISLSNYLIYLHNYFPVMLPFKELLESRYQQTRRLLAEFSWVWRTVPPPITNWKSEEISNQIRITSKTSASSVLVEALKLAKELQSLEQENGWSNGMKWKMVSQVWVEILTYAAAKSDLKEHVKALNRGGELLTMVALLMAHLGLSEQCLNYNR